MFLRKNDVPKFITVLCAASAPMVQLAPQTSIPQLLLLSLIPFLFALRREKHEILKGKIGNVVYVLTMLAIMIGYATEVPIVWQGNTKIAGIVLIVLAFLSQGKNEKVSCAIAGITLLLYMIVICSGLEDVVFGRINWKVGTPLWALIPILELPEIMHFDRKEKMISLSAIILVGIVAVIWTQGIMAYKSDAVTFYEASKSVSGIGSITRMEAVSSIVLTISWFTFFALYANYLNIQSFSGKIAVILCVTAVLMLEIIPNWMVISMVSVCIIYVIPLIFRKYGKMS